MLLACLLGGASAVAAADSTVPAVNLSLTLNAEVQVDCFITKNILELLTDSCHFVLTVEG